MALTVIQEPDNYTPARNPMEVVLETDNYVVNAGVKAKLEIEFSGFPSNGNQFTLAFGNKSRTFTFKSSPDDDLNEILNSDDFMDDWLGAFFKPGIESWYELFTNYTITVFGANATTGSIRIEAKEAGPAWNLTLTEGITVMFTTLNIEGVNRQVRSNYEGLLDVYIEDEPGSDEYLSPITLISHPDESNKLRFRLEEYLSRAFNDPQKPTYNQTTITETENLIRRYYYRYAERYGVPSDSSKYLVSDSILSAFNAGVSFIDFAAGTFQTQYLTNSTNRFLTKMPRASEVTKTQQQYLYYKQNNSATELRLRVKIYYQDNSTYTATFLTKAGPLNGIAILPVGYSQLNLEGVNSYSDTNPIVKYDVWVSYNTGSQLSETITFIVNADYRLYERVFLFRNSFNAFETVWFDGERKTKPNITLTTAQRTLEANYTSDAREETYHDRSHQDEFELSSGWREKDARMHLLEFFASEEVYEITSGKFISCKPIVGDLVIDNEGIPVDSITFTYKYLFSNKGV